MLCLDSGRSLLLGVLLYGLRAQGLVLGTTVYLMGAFRIRICPDLRCAAPDFPRFDVPRVPLLRSAVLVGV